MMTSAPVPGDGITPKMQRDQMIMRDMFLQNAFNAGAKIETPDGRVLTPKRRPPPPDEETYADPWSDPALEERLLNGESQEDLPARTYAYDAVDQRTIIDIDIEEIDQKEIVLLYRGNDGKKKEVTVIIPAPRMEVAFSAGRYQTQIAQKYRLMVNTKSDREANRLDDELKVLNQRLVSLLVPNLEPWLMKRLNLRALTEIVNVAQEMVSEAMSSGPSPVTYIRRLYRLVGSPHGETDRGLMQFLREHFADIEETYGGNDAAPKP